MYIRYASGSYPSDYVPTVFDNYNVNVMFNDQPYSVGLWDTAGEEDYDRLRPLSYPQTDLFLVCFSIVSPCSFRNVREKWYPEISHHCPGTPFVIVGTKRDLRTDPDALERLADRGAAPVSFEMASEMAREIHASAYIETSSLTGDHVQDLFTCAIKIAATGSTGVLHSKRKQSVSSFSWGTLWNAVVPHIGTSRPAATVHRPSWSPLFTNVDVAARYGHTQSRCGSVLFTVGGMCAEGAPPAPEVLRFEYSSGSWLQPIPLGITACNENPRHSVVYKGMTFAASAFVDNLMFLFGGRSNSYTNSLHCLNVTTGEWSLLPEGNCAESPSPRYGSSMISFAKCLFVFGGYDCNGIEGEDVTCYDLTAQTWIPVPIKPGRQAPSGRFHHTAVCHNGNMIIFGGILNGRRLNDVWIFDISSKVWLKPATQGITPPPMRGHSAAVIGDEMFVCSCDPLANPPSMALFKLTLGATTLEWSRVEIGNTPPVREFHTLLSSETGSLILAGGRALTPSGTPSGKMHGDAWWLQLFSNVFGMLPHELWMNIFSYCDPKDLFRLSAVCRDFRALASTDGLWTRFIPTSIISSSSNKGAPLKSLFRSSAAFYIYSSGANLAGDWIFVP
ncbi:cell division control protein 42 [Pelomyxa schiedti]|nr:cell division control protein 42 [Pelomyxa schiedti]